MDQPAPRRVSRMLASLREVLAPRDKVFADLLLEQAGLARSATDLLYRYLESPTAELAEEIASVEERGDRLLSELQRALREALVTPMAGGDINYLGNAVDDLLDQIEDMVTEDMALERVGVGRSGYDEEHFHAVLEAVRGACALLPEAMAALVQRPGEAEGAITELRAIYQEGKRHYSLAYAHIMTGEDETGDARAKNRLRWLRQHLRRIEKLTNAMAGILANS